MIEGKWHVGVTVSNPTTFPNEIIPHHKYHLYSSWICPYALSAVLARNIKGLESEISLSYVDSELGPEGWEFSSKNIDPIHPENQFLHQVYTTVVPNYNGRITVPLLFDITTGKIASNESTEIIRLFDNIRGDKGPILFPKHLDNSSEWKEIQSAINERAFGIYSKAVTPKSSEEMEPIRKEIHDTFSFFNNKLEHKRFLMGEHITYLDLRLFVNLVLFDFGYTAILKININLADYVHLFDFVRDVYQHSGLADAIGAAEIQETAWFCWSFLYTPEIEKPALHDYNLKHQRALIH